MRTSMAEGVLSYFEVIDVLLALQRVYLIQDKVVLNLRLPALTYNT
jgi:hypothetical protein